ncbi:uncharacterized protein K452DRAFT_284061 [Aplosporella prunicola CBS 121167]|uniref:Vps72/YL1 C-terminal domain-containing protein n=1 Tax=Aplosporella prunicola CBS 121167 TaxID=1176127 RepID=A0A6A6BS97_9PEZI|nr:uncharacterized protein K452DRAFT_284061 [Aplosporella prunicola CBS 121167]KAF2145697.1 hypothetical protein K452DRAFT_284061 [Aplosporella prunicola CBS 121167]
MADSEPTKPRQPSPENQGSDDGEPAMVVTRARRSNAGNWMRKLLDQEERHEENAEMVEFYGGEGWAELADDDEFGAYGVEDEGDIALESSGDEDEDEGANDDDDDDDTGEKVIRKEEREQRAAQRKKRKDPFAASALRQKRAKTGSGPSAAAAAAAPGSMAPPPRPKKKSERVSWLPEVHVGPVRSSSRQLSVQNRQMIAQSLEEKERHRLEVLETMRQAEQRKEQGQPKPMTQEERLAEAARVEKRNSKTLSRWEEAERRKVEENKARLEALKNRKLEGAFIRYYSGPSIWVNDKLKFVGKENCKVEDLDLLQEEPTPTPVKAEASEGNTPQVDAASTQDQAPSGDQEQATSNQNQPQPQPQPTPADTTVSTQQPPPPPPPTTTTTPPQPTDAKKPDSFAAPPTTIHQSFGNSIMFPPPEATPGGFLDGILDWASRDPTTTTTTTTSNTAAAAPEPPQSPRRTSAPAATPAPPATQSQEGGGEAGAPALAALPHRLESSSAPPKQPTQQPQQQQQHDPASAPQATDTDTDAQQPSAATEAAAEATTGAPAPTSTSTPTPLPFPPAPLTKRTIQRATRNLITLSSPETAGGAASTTHSTHTHNALTRDKAFLTRTLLAWPATAPTTLPPYPHLPPGTRPGRGSRSHLLHPPRTQCVITAQPARYRDPLTGLAYADAYAFKGLRRFVRDGTARWSSLLGCFVGAREGRWAVARGVPGGFAGDKKDDGEGEGDGEGGGGEAGGAGKEGEAKEAAGVVALEGGAEGRDEGRKDADTVVVAAK